MSQYRTLSAIGFLTTIRMLVILFVVLFGFSGETWGQGKLSRVRSATRTPEPQPRRKASPKPKTQSNQHASDDSSEDSVLGQVISSVAKSRKRKPSSKTPSPTGKLNQVRKTVRQTPHQPAQPPAKVVRGNRRDPFPRPALGSDNRRTPRYCPPPVPQPWVRPRTVVIREPVPVYHTQTVVVQESPVPVVQQPAPNVQPVLAGPATQISEPIVVPVAPKVPVEPLVQAEPMALPAKQPAVPAPVTTANVDLVGRDWFEYTDSRFWASIGSDFDGLTVGTLALAAQQARGLGLDLSVSTFRERGTSVRDNLWLGDVNVVYQLLRWQRMKIKMGAGVNWLGDRFGGEAGFNLTAEAELKLNHRWTLTGHGDLGSLGDADLYHGRVTLHRRLGSDAEWILGAETFDIGGAKLESVFTGIGVRF